MDGEWRLDERVMPDMDGGMVVEGMDGRKEGKGGNDAPADRLRR